MLRRKVGDATQGLNKARFHLSQSLLSPRSQRQQCHGGKVVTLEESQILARTRSSRWPGPGNPASP